jgi:hypothetical protein
MRVRAQARCSMSGCANGYLMESLERWGRRRGMAISVFGLDISPRLVALAR